MTNAFTRCISCGGETIDKIEGKYSITVRNRKTTIPGIEYYSCARCGETFMDLENERKIDAYLKAESGHAMSAK
jgi:YgiT-type zinc finger domain-containing protein